MTLKPLLMWPTAYKKMNFAAAPKEEPPTLKLGDSLTYNCVETEVDELVGKIVQDVNV